MKEQSALIEDLSKDLAESFYRNIQVLSSIVSLSEKFYEGSHSRFVAYYSSQIAENLGMSDEDVMETRFAGLLHDIGKIGLSDAVLFKYPSQMTQQELQQYQLHPQIGKNILYPNNNLSSIAEIIFQHHEKLDGSGFPQNLKKEHTHPAAKIISVVDFYHNSMFKRNKAKVINEKKSNPITNPATYLNLMDDRYKLTLNFLTKKAGITYEKKIVENFIDIIERERVNINTRSVVRIPLNRIQSGMIFADDYYTTYGMLIASRGEVITEDMIKPLVRLAENDEIPTKILVMK